MNRNNQHRICIQREHRGSSVPLSIGSERILDCAARRLFDEGWTPNFPINERILTCNRYCITGGREEVGYKRETIDRADENCRIFEFANASLKCGRIWTKQFVVVCWEIMFVNVLDPLSVKWSVEIISALRSAERCFRARWIRTTQKARSNFIAKVVYNRVFLSYNI